MDENKMNPIPEESADNAEKIEEQVAETVEEAVAQTEEVEAGETVEAVAEEVVADTAEETVENTDEESVEDTAEDSADESADDAAEDVAEETSEEATQETAEETAEPVKKKKMGVVAKILIGILVFILALTVLGLIAVFVASRPPKMDIDEVAVSVDGVDSTTAEFYQTYLYYYSYNSYYGYTDEQLKELAIDQLVFTNSLYAEAMENNFELSAEGKAQIEEQLASVREAAETESMAADDYLDTAFCPGFTLEMYEVITEKSVIAQEYYTSKIEGIKNGYKGDEGTKKIEAAYNEAKTDYDLTDVSYWYFDASAEDSETKANSIVAEVKGGASFADAVKNVAGADAKELTGRSMAELESGSFPADAIDWIYKTDAQGNYVNGKGSVEVVSDDSLIYVLYIENAPARNEIYPVSAYYVQVDVSTDTSVKSEDMLKIEAKNTAEKILKEFEATDKTETDFAQLVEDYGSSDNELVSSDIFEALEGDGSEDAAVEAWLFNSDRKDGDYALVDAGDCYYIVYYLEKAENPVWYDTIYNSLVSKDSTALQETLLESAEETKVVNDDAINDVIEYVEYIVTSQYSSY